MKIITLVALTLVVLVVGTFGQTAKLEPNDLAVIEGRIRRRCDRLPVPVDADLQVGEGASPWPDATNGCDTAERGEHDPILPRAAASSIREGVRAVII
jgi:hypothetical protein